jgi:hypothetical protein
MRLGLLLFAAWLAWDIGATCVVSQALQPLTLQAAHSLDTIASSLKGSQ